MGLDRGHVHTTCTFLASEVKNTRTWLWYRRQRVMSLSMTSEVKENQIILDNLFDWESKSVHLINNLVHKFP